MKKDIHPKLNELNVVLTNGQTIKVMSTYNKGAEMKLDVDPNNHPAWTGKRNETNRGGQAEKFANRFAGFTKKK